MFMDSDDASASRPPADDLQQIKGIGRGIAQRLQDAGVRTFAELAGHARPTSPRRPASRPPA
jgi:predicted flap endonuclease-1-like 5' DNA nuclease